MNRTVVVVSLIKISILKGKCYYSSALNSNTLHTFAHKHPPRSHVYPAIKSNGWKSFDCSFVCWVDQQRKFLKCLVTASASHRNSNCSNQIPIRMFLCDGFNFNNVDRSTSEIENKLNCNFWLCYCLAFHCCACQRISRDKIVLNDFVAKSNFSNCKKNGHKI